MPTLAELALVLFIVLVLFSAKRLPALGDALGATVSRWMHALRGKRTPPHRDDPRG